MCGAKILAYNKFNRHMLFENWPISCFMFLICQSCSFTNLDLDCSKQIPCIFIIIIRNRLGLIKIEFTSPKCRCNIRTIHQLNLVYRKQHHADKHANLVILTIKSEWLNHFHIKSFIENIRTVHVWMFWMSNVCSWIL